MSSKRSSSKKSKKIKILNENNDDSLPLVECNQTDDDEHHLLCTFLDCLKRKDDDTRHALVSLSSQVFALKEAGAANADHILHLNEEHKTEMAMLQDQIGRLERELAQSRRDGEDLKANTDEGDLQLRMEIASVRGEVSKMSSGIASLRQTIARDVDSLRTLLSDKIQGVATEASMHVDEVKAIIATVQSDLTSQTKRFDSANVQNREAFKMVDDAISREITRVGSLKEEIFSIRKSCKDEYNRLNVSLSEVANELREFKNVSQSFNNKIEPRVFYLEEKRRLVASSNNKAPPPSKQGDLSNKQADLLTNQPENEQQEEKVTTTELSNHSVKSNVPNHSVKSNVPNHSVKSNVPISPIHDASHVLNDYDTQHFNNSIGASGRHHVHDDDRKEESKAQEDSTTMVDAKANNDASKVDTLSSDVGTLQSPLINSDKQVLQVAQMPQWNKQRQNAPPQPRYHYGQQQQHGLYSHASNSFKAASSPLQPLQASVNSLTKL